MQFIVPRFPFTFPGKSIKIMLHKPPAFFTTFLYANIPRVAYKQPINVAVGEVLFKFFNFATVYKVAFNL